MGALRNRRLVIRWPRQLGHFALDRQELSDLVELAEASVERLKDSAREHLMACVKLQPLAGCHLKAEPLQADGIWSIIMISL